MMSHPCTVGVSKPKLMSAKAHIINGSFYVVAFKIAAIIESMLGLV